MTLLRVVCGAHALSLLASNLCLLLLLHFIHPFTRVCDRRPSIAVGAYGLIVGTDGIAVGTNGIAVGTDGNAVDTDDVTIGAGGIAVGTYGIIVGTDDYDVGTDVFYHELLSFTVVVLVVGVVLVVVVPVLVGGGRAAGGGAAAVSWNPFLLFVCACSTQTFHETDLLLFPLIIYY